jgi:hypothetical protein
MIENLDIRTAVHDKGILYKDIADARIVGGGWRNEMQN